ncbi:aminotransferase class V-fold PLP-dependent enzyme [Xylanimonas protaetiae]|uniref:Aminotransferase class V-fold PLP-dependent enzyme n=1 Tax=Xylanimonas protaetiae TaxID=2509457 RepID=A0A4P6FBR4_9MICO|nr:aminotransferase class V-fold PLP-dependent enzyme [Xylanimonas protaetiae]QAY70957.1 aminotransferase class V-fold PLP-dependent enzyme [Xylanimonas protaetiae]
MDQPHTTTPASAAPRRGRWPWRAPRAAAAPVAATERYGFGYLAAESVYLDSACQTLRPEPVVDALDAYYLDYNACGGRVKYAWGRQVDEKVEATRDAVLATLGLPKRSYATSFTLNTTYGLNLLLQQLPAGRYRRVITTHTEHNSVFLATMAFARREGVERLLLERDDAGALVYRDEDLTDALVVVSAMNNVDGAPTLGLPELVAAVRRRGGTTVVDAAQAMAHALPLVRGLRADAVCFSAHKVYGASLGVVAASHELLGSLEVSFLGGGMVANVTESGFTLLPELHTRLEAGLQPWAEIIALGAALAWLGGVEAATGEAHEARERRLAAWLHDGLAELPRMRLLGERGSSLLSIIPERVDGHRLAGFLSKAEIMVRSGYFCTHHWLQEREGYDPLVRFSLGAHTTQDDVDRTLDVVGKLLRGL